MGGGGKEEEEMVAVVRVEGAMAEAMAEEGSEYAVCERAGCAGGAGGAGGDGVGILECFLTNGSHGLDIPFPRSYPTCRMAIHKSADDHEVLRRWSPVRTR